MTKEIKELTIERSKWGEDVLHDPETYQMCVLGFFALKVGYTTKQINGLHSLKLLVIWYGNRFPDWICDRDGHLTSDAEEVIEVNDSLCGENREAKLREMFAKHNVQLRFT
jgi:hypothetical protein